jgi:hypothetical protein
LLLPGAPVPAVEAEFISLPWLPGVALFAVLMAIEHLRAPGTRRLLKGYEPIITSLGGGMAVTYVFIQLLPELGKANAVLGRLVFMLTLVGFLWRYSLGEYLYRRSQAMVPGAELKLYRVKLAQAWVYNWLIVFGIAHEFKELGVRTLAIAMAMLLHVGHNDFCFGREYPDWFDRRGRYVLALAPIVGWATAVATTENSEAINDTFIALLAGMLLYEVFTEELPSRGGTLFVWFLVGVGSFAFLFLVGS